MRERFFTPRLRVKSYEELNAWLLDKCIAHTKAHRASRTPRPHGLGGASTLALRAGAGAQARRWRNGAPFKDWILPATLERVRRKLAGADDGDRQMVDILTAVFERRAAAVEAACAAALRESVHSADVVVNILARRREPPAPMHHRHARGAAPAASSRLADCARYDSLRRAA